MPKNRGKQGRDDYLFGESFMQRKIKEAVADMSFLLERGYGESSSCELVGNRYKLNKRQQQAVKGMAASNTAIVNRKSKQIHKESLAGNTLIIDGFNQLILLETMLSNAYIFKGKDGVYRDLSCLYGTYKSVDQTPKAMALIAEFYKENKIAEVIWVFDKPVSNSGRIKTKLTSFAQENNYNWSVLLENNPDKMIAESKYIAITSDAWIIENVNSWYNILDDVIANDYASLVTC